MSSPCTLADAGDPKAVGKTGALRLVFQDDGRRTIIKDQFSKVPLHAQRAMYYDESCPGMAYLYMVSASGGVLQGDRYRIDVMMKRGSKAHVTTQGATRIYGMESGNAIQLINVTLEEDSYLEFISDQLIPYRNSRFRQDVNLIVHDSATVVYSEIIAPGRTARGEMFEYDVLRVKTSAVNQEGVPRLIDAAVLEPKSRNPEAFGVLGGNATTGSVYILTKRQNVPGLQKEIGDMIAESNVSAGVSTVKDGTGLLVRILSDRTDATKDVILEIAELVRRRCTGFSCSGIRKS